MKKLLTLLLLLPGLLFGQKKFNEAMLMDFNKKLKASPEATIKANTHPNFTFITGKGQRFGYNELLANYTYNVEPIREMTDLKISQVGNTATATGQIHHAWHPKGKAEELTHYTGMFTYVYAYEAGLWKILSAQHTDLPKTERNKAIYQKINQLANQAKLEEVSNYYADEHEIAGVGKGPKAELIYAQAVMKSFPDLQIKILNLMAEGDLVMARCEATGTQLGEMNGIPATGKKGNIAHLTINRFNAEGKITESWNLNDNLGMMQQLGILK
jgi:predicted ester cyclase